MWDCTFCLNVECYFTFSDKVLLSKLFLAVSSIPKSLLLGEARLWADICNVYSLILGASNCFVWVFAAVCGCLTLVNVISSMLASSLLISMYLTGLNSPDPKDMLSGMCYLFRYGLKVMVLSLRFTSSMKDWDFLNSSLVCNIYTIFLTNSSIFYYLWCFATYNASPIDSLDYFFLSIASRLIFPINLGSSISV